MAFFVESKSFKQSSFTRACFWIKNYCALCLLFRFLQNFNFWTRLDRHVFHVGANGLRLNLCEVGFMKGSLLTL